MDWLDRFHAPSKPMTSRLEGSVEGEHQDCCGDCPLALGCSRGSSYCGDPQVDLRH